MSKRFLVLEVRVFEENEDGKILTMYSQHKESYNRLSCEQDRIADLMRCAYEAFDNARCKFYGLPEKNES